MRAGCYPEAPGTRGLEPSRTSAQRVRLLSGLGSRLAVLKERLASSCPSAGTHRAHSPPSGLPVLRAARRCSLEVAQQSASWYTRPCRVPSHGERVSL